MSEGKMSKKKEVIMDEWVKGSEVSLRCWQCKKLLCHERPTLEYNCEFNPKFNDLTSHDRILKCKLFIQRQPLKPDVEYAELGKGVDVCSSNR